MTHLISRLVVAVALAFAPVAYGQPADAQEPVQDACDKVGGNELTGEDDRPYKLHQYRGYEFKIFKPVNYTLAIEGPGGSGTVSLGISSTIFTWETARASNLGHVADVSSAVRTVLDNLIRHAERRPVELPPNELDEFYESLGDKER